jgi:RNA polymerase sigma factor (sigma-70 family)
VRVLGHRDDAADATQEVLLKVVTHLGSFRAESAFATWVWRVAHNHLMTARTRSAQAPHVSLEGLAERLGLGVELAAHLAQSQAAPALLTPEDKLEARQMALACTQTMLMTLDREQRLIYVLDTVFDLPSKEAAAVVGITPDAHGRLHGTQLRTGQPRSGMHLRTPTARRAIHPQVRPRRQGSCHGSAHAGDAGGRTSLRGLLPRQRRCRGLSCTPELPRA